MILAIANQKGGVGKTTTAINLGAALALRGKRTLLIDLDPQANSTMSYLDVRGRRRAACTTCWPSRRCAVGRHHRADAGRRTSRSSPARIALAKLEAKLVGEIDAHFRLKDRLDAGPRRLTTSSSSTARRRSGLLTVNALVAATHLLIPIQSSYFALEGTDDLLETVEKVRSRANPDLEILGVLITMHDRRTALARDIRGQIQKVFGAEGVQHGHHQERAARGEPGLQGIDLHLRAGLERGDRVLHAVRGGHRPCLGAACRRPCGCVTTSTTSRRWRRRPERPIGRMVPIEQIDPNPTSRGR